MATFRDLYRTRRGTVTESVENFLIAASSLVLTVSPAARGAFGRLFGVEGLETAMVHLRPQLPLFHHKTNEAAGRTDLRIDWVDGSHFRSLVVECKVGAPVDLDQIQRYSEALGGVGQVGLLTVTQPRLELWKSWRTWSQFADELAELPREPIIDALLAHLRDLGIGECPRMPVHSAATPSSSPVAAFSAAAAALVPALLPKAAGLANLGSGHTYDDAHRRWTMTWEPEDVGRRLALEGLGLSTEPTPLGGLSIDLWALPRLKSVRTRLLKEEEWHEDDGWLRANLGVWQADDTVAAALGEAVARGRHLLVRPTGTETGLWKLPPGSKPAVSVAGSVAELVAALKASQRLQESSALLARSWLQATRRALGGDRTCNRIVHHRNGSFYDKGHRIQVGTSVDPTDHDPVSAWVWFKSPAQKEATARLLESAGWECRRDGNASERTLLAIPPTKVNTMLTRECVEGWGESLGRAIGDGEG